MFRAFRAFRTFRVFSWFGHSVRLPRSSSSPIRRGLGLGAAASLLTPSIFIIFHLLSCILLLLLLLLLI